MRRRRALGGLSVKSARLLERWGVEEALGRGEPAVAVGPGYRMPDGRVAHLGFARDEDGRLCVGLAVAEGRSWRLEEGEPFSARTLGYYRRWLRRVGEYEGGSQSAADDSGET